MSDVFISYARSTTSQALAAAEALRAAGYSVWLDEDLPAHRPYAREIEAQLKAAKAALVVWSAAAVESEWVLSEANRAREDRKLVQMSVDGAPMPMPFDQIQCADVAGWTGEPEAPGWRKVVASIGELVRGTRAATALNEAFTQAPLPLPSKPSIAVLPFANLSGDPEQDYFADGMVEEIVAGLTRYRSIFVIASSSTLSLKGKTIGPPEVARQLGVRYLLQGSVRKAGGRVRIAVNLIDAADGAQIWAERFEDTLEDIFALQDKVALAVAGVIEPTVRRAEVRRAAKRPTEDMGAYDLYLRALPLHLTAGKAEVFKALDLLERAIALDADFAPAIAGLAICHYFIVVFAWADDLEPYRRRGIELAHRAVSVGADDAAVLSQAANALSALGGDIDSAAALLERATALNPGSSDVWYRSGVMQVRLGEPDIAIQHFEEARRLDPLSMVQPAMRMFTGVARFQQGRFAEAVTLLKEAVQEVGSPLSPAMLASALGHLGRLAEAQKAIALYQERSRVPLERFIIGRPEQAKLFRDGIAMAEGKIPPDASTTPQDASGQ